jgi:hypothetical protein
MMRGMTGGPADAQRVHPPARESGLVWRDAFRPADLHIGGAWRFVMVRAWARGPGQPWRVLVEWENSRETGGSERAWVLYDPAVLVPLEVGSQPPP